jgi:hypothetical protein
MLRIASFKQVRFKKGQSAKVKQSFPENLMKLNISTLKLGLRDKEKEREKEGHACSVQREACSSSLFQHHKLPIHIFR